jgi:hypothetical protein
MTPKEKSMQLIYAFEAFTDRDNELEFAKQCALIAVDEILSVLFQHHKIDYWKEVKHEIEKL